MGTGYTRNDTANNIADGNVINASDLDGEFDAIQSAFNGTTGHSHDGTTGEGPQIDTAGIADNAVTLGTKTSGNYVAAGAVSGVGLSGSASAEGATFTVTSNATNANTASTIVSRDASGNFSAGTITAALSGNATTATTLATARTIAGQSFDGSANISIAPTDLTSVTATAAELNILDGVTATTAELNFVDGVTSNIQTQINNINTDLLNDTTPQLGGNLDLNSNNITGTGNISVTGNVTADGVRLGDGDYAAFGDGLDLQILHNGSDSFITDAGTGDMYIRGDNSLFIQNSGGTENKAQFVTDGAVNLFYDNATKISTTSTGIDVTGDVLADTVTLDNGASDWQFSVSGNNLIISYGGTSKAKLDTSGNLTVVGDVTAFGTI
jgi:hypothetical protein